jgi:hypothetical protein
MGDNRGGGGRGRWPSTVKTMRGRPHPLRCRCCCPYHHCRPPSRRSTSREGCRRPPTPTSTPSPLTRNVVDVDNDGAMVAAVIAIQPRPRKIPIDPETVVRGSRPRSPANFFCQKILAIRSNWVVIWQVHTSKISPR